MPLGTTNLYHSKSVSDRVQCVFHLFVCSGKLPQQVKGVHHLASVSTGASASSVLRSASSVTTSSTLPTNRKVSWSWRCLYRRLLSRKNLPLWALYSLREDTPRHPRAGTRNSHSTVWLQQSSVPKPADLMLLTILDCLVALHATVTIFRAAAASYSANYVHFILSGTISNTLATWVSNTPASTTKVHISEVQS